MEKTTHTKAPIVAVVGHIDHGKSTLLDYIRKSNVTEGEAGGITQRLSAYEAEHVSGGQKHTITFLDTPGHEAFRAMRSRGLEVADVAVLVVASDDGVKAQTVEAFKLIESVGIPFIVALTKIDKPGSDIEKAKMSLLEHSIFLEGLGGDIPFVGISSKTGEGIPELLDLILLAAELEDTKVDTSLPGVGLVIEARIDPKRGNMATLVVKNGAVHSGEFVVCGESMAPVRIMENFLSKPITDAFPGSPINIIGFSSLPVAGAQWSIVATKKDAERAVDEARAERLRNKTTTPTMRTEEDEEKLHITLPVVIKTDFSGTGDAVLHELEKLPKDERLEVRIVNRSVGAITEGDVRLVGSGKNPGIILGFNVKVEKEARELAERLGVEVALFDIIYKLTEWFGEQLVARRPRQEGEEKTGSAKILKFFSAAKDRMVVGGRVEEGALVQGDAIKIIRNEIEIGRGEIMGLQAQKIGVKKVETGSEFGALIKVSVQPAAGDILEACTIAIH